jgi:hypothetical protein
MVNSVVNRCNIKPNFLEIVRTLSEDAIILANNENKPIYKVFTYQQSLKFRRILFYIATQLQPRPQNLAFYLAFLYEAYNVIEEHNSNIEENPNLVRINFDWLCVLDGSHLQKLENLGFPVNEVRHLFA